MTINTTKFKTFQNSSKSQTLFREPKFCDIRSLQERNATKDFKMYTFLLTQHGPLGCEIKQLQRISNLNIGEW